MVRSVAEMGEIRVDVTLSSSLDEALVRRGKLPVTDVRQVAASALVDTGAIRSFVPQEVADQLGVQVVGEFDVELADGNAVTVGLSEPIRFRLLDRSVTEEAIVMGNGVLLGQTVLETTDLLADCANQRLIPNPAHPDGPVLKVKGNIRYR